MLYCILFCLLSYHRSPSLYYHHHYSSRRRIRGAVFRIIVTIIIVFVVVIVLLLQSPTVHKHSHGEDWRRPQRWCGPYWWLLDVHDGCYCGCVGKCTGTGRTDTSSASIIITTRLYRLRSLDLVLIYSWPYNGSNCTIRIRRVCGATNRIIWYNREQQEQIRLRIRTGDAWMSNTARSTTKSNNGIVPKQSYVQ